MSVGLNNTERKTLELLLINPNENAASLGEQLGVTMRTAERTLKSLQEKDILKGMVREEMVTGL